MKKCINIRKILLSILVGFFLGIGFIFFLMPIRDASIPVLFMGILLIAVIFYFGMNKGLYYLYQNLSRPNKVFSFIFLPLFSFLLLVSLKGEQLYLQDNHFLIILYVYVSTFLTLLLMVTSFVHLILTLKVKKEIKAVPKYRILLYALPSIVVFSLYLVGFFPGLMTVDSNIQWFQIHSNQYNDWHPVVHTWFLKLITQIWDYPAAIGITQILMMSFTFGYGMYSFEKYGVRRWVLYVVTAAFALMPLNGIYSVTLWKDVLYSTAIMFVTIVLFHIVMTKGKWLLKSSNLFLFFLASTEFVFFRHNGFPAFVVTMVIFFIIYRMKLKRMYIVGIAVIALHFIVTGPIFKYFEVIPSDPNEAYSVPIQQIGRIIAYDGNITKEQLDFYDQVLPIEEWKTKYNPFLADPLKGHPDYNREFLYANKTEYFKHWLELCLQNPMLAIDAYTDMSSIVWRISKPENSYQYIYAVDTPTVETLKEYNIEPRYGHQGVKHFLSGVLQKTSTEFLPLYRPATYLFGMVLLLFIAILKGQWKISLIALPVLLNIASVAVALPAQDVRYLYANFLVLPIILLATIAVKQPKEE